MQATFMNNTPMKSFIDPKQVSNCGLVENMNDKYLLLSALVYSTRIEITYDQLIMHDMYSCMMELETEHSP